MQSRQPILVAVPNVSEGRDARIIDAIGAAFSRRARLLDVHSDPDHGRSVYTIAAPQGQLSQALVQGARAAVERIDLTTHEGQHPHAGAIDVAPVVYRDESQHGAACAEALTAAALIGDDLELPVFLYGELAGGRERAEIRRGGVRGLQCRGTVPDFGPKGLSPRTGAVLVAARPPLIAFNINLETDDVAIAKRIASEIRESAPNGLRGVRAIGLQANGRAQVSTNIHDHRVAPVPEVLRRVEEAAEVADIEFVGLPPEHALAGIQTAGVRTLEEALGSAPRHGSDQEEAPSQ